MENRNKMIFKNNWRRRCWSALLLAVILIAAFLHPCAAAEEPEETVLRVAFPNAAGYTSLSEEGKPVGVVVDFLNEIAKYTGWKYEYIPSGNVIRDFQDGKFDLMGGTFYNESLSEQFAYPDYNCGYTQTKLLARKDDHSIRSYDLGTFNGKTIGVYDRSTANIHHMEEWLAIQDLDCQIRYYTHDDLSAANNLYERLENGEVDLLLGYGTDMPDTLYTAAAFSSQAHYIVTTPGNQAVLDALNMAMGRFTPPIPILLKRPIRRTLRISVTGTLP